MLTPLYVAASLSIFTGRVFAQSSSGMTNVRVGPDEDPLAFVPSSVELRPGSLGVTFQYFGGGRHSLRQSTFEDPCTWAGTGTYSVEYVPGRNVPIDQITIDPKIDVIPAVYFFDDVGDRCQQGMVFAINPPSNEAFEDFRSRAMASSNNASSSTSSSAPSSSSQVPVSSASSASLTESNLSPSPSPSASNPETNGNSSSSDSNNQNDNNGAPSVAVGRTAGVMGVAAIVAALVL